MNINFTEKTVLLRQNIIGLIDKFLHQLTLHGARGVDCDHKITHLFNLLVLQRLNQGHILIKLQTIGVKYVIELIIINLHFLAQHGKKSL